MTTYRVVIHERDFPIQPDHIATPKGGHFWNAFDNTETEISARYVVRLCQRKGGWYPFSYDEIEALYNEAGYRNFAFNRLIEPGMAFYIQKGRVPEGGGWIIEQEGQYFVTDDFILRCYKSSPVDVATAERKDNEQRV